MKAANDDKAPKPRWFIVIQRRCDYNGLFDPHDFRAYRHYSVWPKTFTTARECDGFISKCFTFKGLPPGKKSASSMNQRSFRDLLPGAPDAWGTEDGC